MKKILSILLTMLIVMTTIFSLPAMAADDVKVSVDVSLYDIVVTVTANQKGTMTAQLVDDSEKVFYGMYSVKATENDGEYIYEFSFRLPDGTNREAATTGIYKIRLGNNVIVPDTTFNFVSPSDRITLYNELNDKDAESIYNFLTVDRKSFVTIDLTDYISLTGNVLNLVNAKIADFGTSYTDIAKGDTTTLATVENNFKAMFSSAMTIAKMATVTEDKWEDFADDMFDAKIFEGTYYVDTVGVKALLNVVNVYAYYKREIEGITVLDAAEYAKAFDKATLHLIEEVADYGTFKNAFLHFNAKGTISPDMTNINKIVNAGKDADLWKNVMADNNANCDALVNNVVAEAKTLIDNGILDTSSGGGGGGGGGAGGSSPIDKPSAPSAPGALGSENTTVILPTTNPTATGTFKDVADSHWAKESIETLAEKGILNGKGDGQFAPNDSVTREEFVKIIVVAFGLTEDGSDCSFNDVDKTAWSYPYIASANALGIVSGDGKSFNPKSGVSRQDMAVIIYRVFEHMGLNVSGNKISFDDNGDIAGYAKDAVDTLTAAGIINGMGDGTFAPKASVTRAQAAKVVCGLLDLVGGGK